MQQITVGQMNGTSGGSLRQKLDLSDACQATDAFAMLFMQLMGQTIQPEMLVQAQGEQPLARADAVLPAAAMTVGQMPLGDEVQTMLTDLIQNAGSTPAEGEFAQALAVQPMEAIPGAATAEETVQGIELLDGKAEGVQQLCTVLKAAWGGQESSSRMEHEFSSLQAGNAFRAARQLLEQQEKETVILPVDVESLQADVNAGRFLTAQPEAPQLPLPSAEEIGKQLKTGILHQTAQGKSEFIVRLEPEGIGEIVVKISDDREHMALSIFTASAQAARLISHEVSTLQEALRPLQVQVQQVTLLPTEQAVSYASQSALTGQGQQSFAQQYFEQRQQRHGGRWQQEDDSFEAAIGQAQAPESELDAYI